MEGCKMWIEFVTEVPEIEEEDIEVLDFEEEEEVIKELPEIDGEAFNNFQQENAEKTSLTPSSISKDAKGLDNELGALNEQILGANDGGSILDKLWLGKMFWKTSEFKRESFEGKINSLMQNYQNKIDDTRTLIEIDTVSLVWNEEWLAKYKESIEGIKSDELPPVEKVRLNQRAKTIDSIELSITLLTQRLQECKMLDIIMTESKSRLRGQFTQAIQNIGAWNIIADSIATMDRYETTAETTEKNTVDKAIENSKNILTTGKKVLSWGSSAVNLARLSAGTQNNLLSLNIWDYNGDKK